MGASIAYLWFLPKAVYNLKFTYQKILLLMLKSLPASIICLFLTTVFGCVFVAESPFDNRVANLCGDLIARYTVTPDSVADKLHFQQCKILGGQELVRATYTVNNADSVAVESYFMKKYEMPKLDWVDVHGKLRCHGGMCIFGTPRAFGEAFTRKKSLNYTH